MTDHWEQKPKQDQDQISSPDNQRVPDVIPAGNVYHGQDEKPWGAFDLLHGVLFSPIQALKAVAKQQPLGLALAVVVGESVLNWATNSAIDFKDLPLPGPIGSLPQESFHRLFSWLGFLGLLVGMLFWLVAAGVYNLLGELLGGKGNAKGLLAALGIAMLPGIFYTPLNFISNLLPGGQFIYGLGAFGIGIWSAVLHILAIRETLQLSTIKAVVVALVPLFSFLLFFILLAASFFFALSPLMPHMPRF